MVNLTDGSHLFLRIFCLFAILSNHRSFKQIKDREQKSNQRNMVKKPHSRNRTKIKTEWINAGYTPVN